MQTYNHLLEQFHQGQVSIIESDSHIKYKDLLNEVRRSKWKKNIFKKEKSYEKSRIKQQNQAVIKKNLLQRSFKSVKVNFANQQCDQKLCIFTLQKQSLEQQIKQLKSSINEIKSEKLSMEDKLKILENKGTETYRTNIQSIQIKKHLENQINQLKIEYKENQRIHEEKLKTLQQKIESIKQQNLLNSSKYKMTNQGIQKSQHMSFLDSIVGWGKQVKKNKQFKGKIYLKEQIQSILRTFYIISKLSTLKYGNIIQILSKNKDSKSSKTISLQDIKMKIIYTDGNGEQISIIQLINKINQDLLSQQEMKFLSKFKIIQYYSKLNVRLDQSLVTNIKNHFFLITSWFTRIQHRNIQLSQEMRHLKKTEQALNKKIQSIQQKAQNSHIFYIQEREKCMDILSSNLDNSSKIIFQFNIRSHQLINRFTALNKLFDKIIKKTERKTFRKEFASANGAQQFLQLLIKILSKSPEHVLIEWNNTLKKIRNSFLKKTSKSLGNLENQASDQNNEGTAYLKYIMKNDLLRVYAKSQMYNGKLSDLQNLSNTCNQVFQFQDKIIDNITRILRDLLLFSKNGIDQFLKLYQQNVSNRKQKRQTYKGMFPKKEELSRFFLKDEIKEKYCVESPQYFRRDNFRLVQKLQRIQLKRKGLFIYHPFCINTSNELTLESKTQISLNATGQSSGFRSARGSYRKLQSRLSHKSIKHNFLSTSRQKQNIQKKDLRQLLNNISNIASQNHKYRIMKKTQNQNCTTTSTPTLFQQKSFASQISHNLRNKRNGDKSMIE